MVDMAISRVSSRRELLKAGGLLAGAGLFSSLLPREVLAGAPGRTSQAAAQAPSQAAAGRDG